MSVFTPPLTPIPAPIPLPSGNSTWPDILVEDMKAIGIEDAFVDEHCYVYGTLPATPGCEDKPALGLIAHMDTAAGRFR